MNRRVSDKGTDIHLQYTVDEDSEQPLLFVHWTLHGSCLARESFTVGNNNICRSPLWAPFRPAETLRPTPPSRKGLAPRPAGSEAETGSGEEEQDEAPPAPRRNAGRPRLSAAGTFANRNRGLKRRGLSGVGRTVRCGLNAVQGGRQDLYEGPRVAEPQGPFLPPEEGPTDLVKVFRARTPGDRRATDRKVAIDLKGTPIPNKEV